jgi:hypothetical protein
MTRLGPGLPGCSCPGGVRLRTRSGGCSRAPSAIRCLNSHVNTRSNRFDVVPPRKPCHPIKSVSVNGRTPKSSRAQTWRFSLFSVRFSRVGLTLCAPTSSRRRVPRRGFSQDSAPHCVRSQTADEGVYNVVCRAAARRAPLRLISTAYWARRRVMSLGQFNTPRRIHR